MTYVPICRSSDINNKKVLSFYHIDSNDCIKLQSHLVVSNFAPLASSLSQNHNIKKKRILCLGVGWMAQLLRVLTALLEDWSLITFGAITPSPVDVKPIFAFCIPIHMCAYAWSDTYHIYKKPYL